MKAKEMFEKLGYKLQMDYPYLQYHNLETDTYIWFYGETKTIEIQFDITMDLLKAINKQIEELGWDNESNN